jgi:hypothetical protein
MRAVNCGKTEVVRLLLERGADWQIADKEGALPMDAARRPEIVELLREAVMLRGSPE